MTRRGWFRPSLRLPDSPPDRRRKNGNGPLWRRRPLSLAIALCVAVYTLCALRLRFLTEEKTWLPPFGALLGPPTLVVDVRDLRRVWEWEIAAGHYPSARKLPAYMGETVLDNPARPANVVDAESFSDGMGTRGVGPARVYTSPRISTPNVAYPPRPIPGSAADLDMIMEHCDFGSGKYVRDCLKLLRNGAELDSASRHVRGGAAEQFKYIYLLENHESAGHPRSPDTNSSNTVQEAENIYHHSTHRSHPRSSSHLHLPPLPNVNVQNAPHNPCHGLDRRIFHLFWTGPFTDKPYMALLSFLYTQNLGLHLPLGSAHPHCHTELWFWVSQPQWARHPRETWEARLLAELQENAWARVFLHPRFREVVKFKVWDTEEQLDAVEELSGEWRRYRHRVFKSKVARDGDTTDDTPINAAGSTSNSTHSRPALAARSPAGAASYDKPSVALSDLVRFVLCHRHGGVYLDVDVLLLRDWETLWGAPGAFAYRWSRLPRYNTAVLRLHAASALGALLLRTALRNGMRFHPIHVGSYVRDAQLRGLLARLPDALFDPAWLTVEGYQRERPPQPQLNTFHDFFDTPAQWGASPEALGFDGFFKGAYSYHYHNDWWTPFDPERNYPDLGPRFVKDGSAPKSSSESVRDLSWSAVIKRTFEAYIRGEQPNMYGEWIQW